MCLGGFGSFLHRLLKLFGVLAVVWGLDVVFFVVLPLAFLGLMLCGLM